MICEYCDNEVPAGARHCPSCGAVQKTAVVMQATPRVQVVAAPSVSGMNQMQPSVNEMRQQSVVERKSRVAYILLGIFLGGLGIHNFYAERLNRGLGQLLVTLLTGWLVIPLIAVFIWVLCDICVITTDGSGTKFK